uniref:Uncharacterized protein n=1 Tax=Kalanchoe fedtschenkoi TaxID=63787 RepID=A0A7N0V832_KALFE
MAVTTRGMRKKAAANSAVERPNDAEKKRRGRPAGSTSSAKRRKVTKTSKRKVAKTAEEAQSVDPQMCPAYASDIYSYLRHMETQRPVRRDGSMRGELVDWLVDASYQHDLLSNTLHLGVSLMDRYLSLNAVSPEKLTLLGVSCILVAAKYEETNPPHVRDVCRCIMEDEAYEKDEIVEMEATVLKALEFHLGDPTASTFLPWFTKIVQEKFKKPDLKLELLCCFLADLSLSDHRCCATFLPSQVAASAVFLAAFTMWPESRPWNTGLQELSGYTPAQLSECVLILLELQQLSTSGEGKLVAVKERYEKRKFKGVAKLSSLPQVPASYFEDIST